MYFFAPKTAINNDANATLQGVNKLIDEQKTAQSAPSAANAPSANPSPNAKNAPTTTDSTKIIATIKGDKAEFQIDELGRITSAKLKEKKYLNEDGSALSLFDEHTADKSEIAISDSPQSITLTQDLGEVEGVGAVSIKKILTFNNDLSFKVQVILSAPLNYFVANGARPIAATSPYVFKGVIIKKNDEKIEKIEEGDSADETNFSGANFVASVDQYYASALFSESGVNVVIDTNTGDKPFLSYIYFTDSAEFSGYIGPKNYQDLKAISPTLTDIVEYGIITFFAKPLFLLLEWLFGIFKNWGWAIIGLTLIVRIVLYPLTYKGMVSMQKLKDLAPKMKEIQEKYKGDPQKTQLHIMELYKKHRVNPMGGCLPLILQIPVFFAIYRVLYNAVELKDAAWLLWISDLSVRDPYFILPILMGATMYLQQRLSPTTFNDPIQEKIFKYLPLVFAIFLATFPAGLILYWTVNNIFSIIQQLLINKVMARKKADEIAEHRAEHDAHRHTKRKDNS